MTAFYNEHDPYAAAWLRELIREGLIAPGVVDERDIQRLREVDLGAYTQVHLFAGIGGWSLALRLSGWPDDRPVWTGSCPCQPFSSAGKRKGTRDARHLWPWMRHLMFRWRPAVAFGEQVASADGRQWLAGVRANLETLGYAVGAADLCAAGAGEEGEGWFVRGDRLSRERIVVGAPNVRQRLWWVADAGRQGLAGRPQQPAREELSAAERSGHAGRVAHAAGAAQPRLRAYGGEVLSESAAADDRDAGFWCQADLVACTDGYLRRVEPGTFPLAHGLPRSLGSGSTREQRLGLASAKRNRVARLRGYGNAIVPHVAAEFVRAWLDVTEAA